jgi:hypothetical protein
MVEVAEVAHTAPLQLVPVDPGAAEQPQATQDYKQPHKVEVKGLRAVQEVPMEKPTTTAAVVAEPAVQA